MQLPEFNLRVIKHAGKDFKAAICVGGVEKALHELFKAPTLADRTACIMATGEKVSHVTEKNCPDTNGGRE